jgi:C4-dicarboxylate transporter DctQ subunit
MACRVGRISPNGPSSPDLAPDPRCGFYAHPDTTALIPENTLDLRSLVNEASFGRRHIWETARRGRDRCQRGRKMNVTWLLTKAGSIFDRLLDFFAILAGIVISFVTISVCAGILSRYFLNRPISWVVEISEYGLLYMTFLVAAWVLRHERHVSVDLVYNRLSRRNQSVASIFTSAVAGIVFLLVTFYGFKVTKHQFDTKYFTPTILEAPKFAITLIIPVGTSLLFIEMIRKIYGHIQEWINMDAFQFRKKEADGGPRVEP